MLLIFPTILQPLALVCHGSDLGVSIKLIFHGVREHVEGDKHSQDVLDLLLRLFFLCRVTRTFALIQIIARHASPSSRQPALGRYLEHGNSVSPSQRSRATCCPTSS